MCECTVYYKCRRSPQKTKHQGKKEGSLYVNYVGVCFVHSLELFKANRFLGSGPEGEKVL